MTLTAVFGVRELNTSGPVPIDHEQVGGSLVFIHVGCLDAVRYPFTIR